MNLSSLKNIYKNLIPSCGWLFQCIPFSIFCGSVYRKELKFLNYYSNIDCVSRTKIRDRLLLEYLNESINYVPFYIDYASRNNIRKIYSIEQYFDFPIITKEIYSNNPDAFVDLRHKHNSYSASTGGTTGQQISIRLSNCTYAKEWAFVNHFLISNGINPNSKRICLRGVSGITNNDFLGYNPLYKEILVSPFKINMSEVSKNFNLIQNYLPEFIHGYPSSVSEFASVMSELNLSLPSVKNILLVSEKMYSQQLDMILNTFNANVISFYGMTERLVFAPYVNGSFFPHSAYGVCENINDELVATGFINKSTRLIRYRTSDQINSIDNAGFVDEITSITGRWGQDYLIGKNNSKITMTSLNLHCDSLSHVKKYQFYQETKGLCELHIVPHRTITRSCIDTIVNAFQSKVGSELLITAVLKDDIPLTKRGKHVFINNTLI